MRHLAEQAKSVIAIDFIEKCFQKNQQDDCQMWCDIISYDIKIWSNALQYITM